MKSHLTFGERSMMPQTYADVYHLIDTLPVVSSHEHHLPDGLHAGLSLDRVLENSYIGWHTGRTEPLSARTLQEDPLLHRRTRPKAYLLPGTDGSADPRELARQRSAFLARHNHNCYFVWLEKGLQKIYSFDEKIRPENWDWISAQIAARHRVPSAHLDILRQVGRYKHAVQDAYWDYGSDLGHPELFSPTMRVDMFVTSFHPSALDHNGNTPFEYHPQAPTTNFGDYLDFLRRLFTGWRLAGAVAMKSASAYERPLDYGEGSRDTAKRIFHRSVEDVTLSERRAYEDFMFHWFCRLCIELDVPFQVHTGLAQLSGSRPGLFEPLIARYPQIRFVLFHAGYPWCAEVAGLAHNYSNISIDMVWLPIVSTTGAVEALHQFVEVAQSSDLIGWGGDTWTSEEAIGALLAWQHVVARVLSEKVESGYLDWDKAETLAQKLMFRNAASIYGFELEA